MLIFVLFVTLALAGPMLSATLRSLAAMPLSLGMPLLCETPLCPATPHFESSHVGQHYFDEFSQLFSQQLALRCLPLEIPLALSINFLHVTSSSLTTCHLATCRVDFFLTMADHFVCQNKGRALGTSIPPVSLAILDKIFSVLETITASFVHLGLKENGSSKTRE